MFRPYPLFIGARYTAAKRKNHFISFISLSSMIGLMLGVAVLITVLSVMNGFDRELRQRILVHCNLTPLNARDLAHYIQHRITLAGGLGRPRFTRMAIRAIRRHSQGIPRVVNNLCDKSVLAAFIRESDEVTFWDVHRAIRDIRQLDG